jgi:hypothetical protein
MKYNGLRKRSDYEDLLDGILNPKQIVKYPNRDATNALNHPYLNQFRGEFDEMSEQEHAIKKAKVMLLAMQGLTAQTNTQGANITPPPSLMPSTPSSHSVASSFLSGITQGHNIMGGGATHGSSTLNSPRISTLSDRDIPLMGNSQLLHYVNATTNQDSRMYQAVSERDPNMASGSGHQVADAVHENIVDTLTGAAAQRAAVTGGIFQVPHPSFNISTPEIPRLELSLAPPEEEPFLLPPPAQPSSSAAAASATSDSFRPHQFPMAELAAKARTARPPPEPESDPPPSKPPPTAEELLANLRLYNVFNNVQHAKDSATKHSPGELINALEQRNKLDPELYRQVFSEYSKLPMSGSMKSIAGPLNSKLPSSTMAQMIVAFDKYFKDLHPYRDVDEIPPLQQQQGSHVDVPKPKRKYTKKK